MHGRPVSVYSCDQIMLVVLFFLERRVGVGARSGGAQQRPEVLGGDGRGLDGGTEGRIASVASAIESSAKPQSRSARGAQLPFERLEPADCGLRAERGGDPPLGIRGCGAVEREDVGEQQKACAGTHRWAAARQSYVYASGHGAAMACPTLSEH